MSANWLADLLSMGGGGGGEGSVITVNGRTFKGKHSVACVNGRWIVDGKDLTDENNDPLD